MEAHGSHNPGVPRSKRGAASRGTFCILLTLFPIEFEAQGGFRNSVKHFPISRFNPLCMFLSTLIRVGRRTIISPSRWCTCKACPHCLSMRFFTSKNSSDKRVEQESSKHQAQGKKEAKEESLASDLAQEQQPQQKGSIELEAKLAELKDAYLRTLADMENLRQRTRREVEAAKLFGHQAFAKDIISVGEVLEMALASVKKTGIEKDSNTKEGGQVDAENAANVKHQMQDLVDGLSMTLEEFGKALAKHGISVIDPLHQKFDPNHHTALFEVPTEGVEPGTVVVVEKKGYMLHQRLLKSATVGISKAIDNKI